MKRSKKCFDLSSLEEDFRQGDSKRYRTDSDQTDVSMDSELSEISDIFEKSAIISSTSLSCKSDDFISPPLSLDMVGCKFDFAPEQYALGSSLGSLVKAKSSSLGGLVRKNGFEQQ